MPDPLVVIGSGGHAKVVVEAALAAAPGREIIILDDSPEAQSRSIFGIAVSGGRERLAEINGAGVIVAIGENAARARLAASLQQEGRGLETVIHPSAFVADSVELGAGTFVSAGAIVIAEARIGAAAIVNTAASIDHDCVVGDAAHIAPGVHLCGAVTVGARTLVGVGSAIRPGVSVCDDVVVGAGAVVVRDIGEPGTYVGNPAKRLR